MSFITALRAGVSTAWLNLVRVMNGLAAAILGGIALYNSMNPQGPVNLLHSGWQQAVGGIVWCALVHVALTKAKPNA